MVRRVLHVIREEFGQRDLQRSMSQLLEHRQTNKNENVDWAHVKGILHETIREIMDELESLYKNVAAQALEYIHTKYVFKVVSQGS